MKQSYFENECVELWIEDGIIFETFKPEIYKLTLPMAKKIVTDRLKLSNGITMPIFVEFNKTIGADKDARDYFAGEESIRYLNAAAFLISNPIALIVAKLFIAFNKPRVKIEFFNDKKKALAWLQKYKVSQ